ncbi:hypothetical protein PspLS_10548 [Pyricularia sp. CBS 133598]|nr:hypothetical protein PspLS_10548 [Pyricularia sp. CBS 133598]
MVWGTDTIVLQRIIIGNRTTEMTQKLRGKYASETTAVGIHVFCISNEICNDDLHKRRGLVLPRLELSGIPGLRRHCVFIVAEAQYRPGREFIQESVPTLLGSVEL